MRSEQGEKNRIASMPKKDEHWNWNPLPNVLTLHRRLHRAYGSAKNYKCKCGKQAMDWALIGKKYTDNKEDYTPLCRKCHIALDKPFLKVDWSKRHIERDKKGRIIRVVKN